MLVTYFAGRPRVGVVAQDRVVELTVGAADGPTMLEVIGHWDKWSSVVDEARQALATGAGSRLSDVRLLAPIPDPRRNPFLIAGNYQSHVTAGEAATGVPLSQRKTAIFFTKPTTSVAGPTDDIEYDPELTSKLDYELELVLVIGPGGRDIPAERAMDHVFGYTIGNDVSARDIQVVKPTADFLRGKGMDTFFPIGPGIVPRDQVADYRAMPMRLWVNGDLRQEATPAELLRDIPEIVSTLSKGITLLPGDLIATGTPAGGQVEKAEPVWLKDGDEVISEIGGIGRMVNIVRTR